ncbi:MAG TPA: hypothetical protein VEU47_05165, partial [Candidatus Cybelea sp.]|nr:hypothetical protein [Candidatus Cybelea sp.]
MSDAATTQRHQRIAQWLLRQQDEKRAYAPLPPDLALKDGAEAYAVQAVFQNLASERRGPLAGGKVALTTPVMQQLVNYHQPMAGGILARTIHQSPAELSFADFVHPLFECEVAVQLGADLKPGEGPFTAEGLGSAVAACMAAIEIADDRSADYKALDPLLLIAENAWNRGCVLAPPVRNWRALDLPKARGVTRIAGREAGAGFAAGDARDAARLRQVERA